MNSPLKILIKKDIWRARRNPWPFAINLSLPVLITAIIGLAFGPSNSKSGQGIGKITVGIVDHDDSVFGNFLNTAFSNQEAQEFIQAEILPQETALARINDNRLSAVIVIPDNFSDAFLEGEDIPPLELIKNPAQRFHPAILEEFMGIIVEGLNLVSRNLETELPEIVELAEKDEFPDFIQLAGIMIKIGTKFKKAEDFVTPPLITFQEETRKNEAEASEPGFNIFAFLLPMLSSVFLLYLVDSAIRDLYKELNGKTLQRIKTVNLNLFPFVISKSAFAVLAAMIGGLIWFVGGSLTFGIEWKRPLEIFLLIAAYSICAAGFLALLVGLLKSEKRAENFSSIIIMAIAFLGGGFINVDAMPAFIKDQISPWMPNYWFIQSIHSLQFDRDRVVWFHEAIKMVLLGSVFLWIGTLWINRNIEQGNKV